MRQHKSWSGMQVADLNTESRRLCDNESFLNGIFFFSAERLGDDLVTILQRLCDDFSTPLWELYF